MSDSDRTPSDGEEQGSGLGGVILFVLIAVAGIGFAIVLASFVSGPKLAGPPESPFGLAPGAIAPAIEADGWVNGPPPTAEEMNGKVVVVDGWATWCKPCRDEVPHLRALHRKYSDRGVTFIGLTSEGEKSLGRIESFIEHFRITWPNGYGEAAAETLDRFKVDAIPSMFVIGRDGKIVWNRDSDESIEEALDRALATK